jgi:hypothetical protein
VTTKRAQEISGAVLVMGIFVHIERRAVADHYQGWL